MVMMGMVRRVMVDDKGVCHQQQQLAQRKASGRYLVWVAWEGKGGWCVEGEGLEGSACRVSPLLLGVRSAHQGLTGTPRRIRGRGGD